MLEAIITLSGAVLGLVVRVIILTKERDEDRETIEIQLERLYMLKAEINRLKGDD